MYVIDFNRLRAAAAHAVLSPSGKDELSNSPMKYVGPGPVGEMKHIGREARLTVMYA